MPGPAVDGHGVATGTNIFNNSLIFIQLLAQLIIHDNIWMEPKAASARLQAVLQNDPYSKYLKNWIAIFNKRMENDNGK